eukprot:scaffold1734_cov113-Isochrysis_galbana.AAC.30
MRFLGDQVTEAARADERRGGAWPQAVWVLGWWGGRPPPCAVTSCGPLPRCATVCCVVLGCGVL